ncbi:hypothetical protein JCM9957A_48390 [Kineosporia succinea]
MAVGLTYALIHRGSDAPAPAATPTSTITPRTPNAADKEAAFGVFCCWSPDGVRDFGDWAGRDVQYVVDFSLRRTWNDIANPFDQLKSWQDEDYRIVFGLAMLPEDDSLDVSLAAGARGDYDEYYRTLAQNLVAYGQGDAVLRLGWEFNLGSWRWHPGEADDFIAYWRRVVTTMRAVPGAEGLAFDWNVNNGGNTYDSTRFYPGRDYVDYVGVDVYDISWAKGTYPYPDTCSTTCRRQRQAKAWNDTYDSRYGLRFWSRFAARQGKPMSLPEWGLWERPDGHGGGDNPYFIERMHEFIADPANNVAYQAYFEYDVKPDGNHRLRDLKNSGRVFRELFAPS